MPSAPVPCLNCKRFHHGTCFNVAKTCHDCGGLNHISRYCPLRRRIHWEGGPMPGCKDWCTMWGLDNDSRLRENVLASLKNTPDSAIWIDGTCIYQGHDRFFHSDSSRGRQLKNRHMRLQRSMSPPSERRSKDDGGGRSKSPRGNTMFRFRSPLRQRSPSRSPIPLRLQRGTLGRLRFENATDQRTTRRTGLSDERKYYNDYDDPAAEAWPQGLEYDDNLDELGRSARHLSDVQSHHQQRSALVDITNSHNDSGWVMKYSQATPLHSKHGGSTPLELFPETVKISSTQIQDEDVALGTFAGIEEQLEIEDPHFVLSVNPDATEEEIMKAYKERLWEVQMDRMADADPTQNVYNQSVSVLAAAKRQLLGY